MTSIIYVGTSLDGYIADREGRLDWLMSVPIPEGDDLGFAGFMAEVDALVMGRITYESVLGFDQGWPYDRPVYVLSRTLESVPDDLAGRVVPVRPPVRHLLATLEAKGLKRIYVDGGETIRSFLLEDLVDELVLTRVPVLLGGGVPLFGELAEPFMFEHLGTEVLLGQLVKSRYRRKR